MKNSTPDYTLQSSATIHIKDRYFTLELVFTFIFIFKFIFGGKCSSPTHKSQHFRISG